MLHLVLNVILDVVDVLVPLVADIIDDAEQFVVAACFVGHLKHTDRAGLNDHAGEYRLRKNDQRIERIAILTERVVNKAVVGGVSHGGEEVPVQVDLARFVIDFVLVA